MDNPTISSTNIFFALDKCEYVCSMLVDNIVNQRKISANPYSFVSRNIPNHHFKKKFP